MGTPTTLEALRYTDRDLIESIINNYFIIDYGFITKVNPDKTINVTHAGLMQLNTGKTLPATQTENIEVLTVSGAGFAVNFDYQKGDKVLLLGLKTLVKSTADVSAAELPDAFVHYSRETLKALPLCAFSSDAKVKVEAEGGTLKVTTSQNIELNGNTKQFVTWAELNQALQALWSTIKTHTHIVSTTGSATAQTGTAAASTEMAGASLDISSAKTTKVVTG